MGFPHTAHEVKILDLNTGFISPHCKHVRLIGAGNHSADTKGGNGAGTSFTRTGVTLTPRRMPHALSSLDSIHKHGGASEKIRRVVVECILDAVDLSVEKDGIGILAKSSL